MVKFPNGKIYLGAEKDFIQVKSAWKKKLQQKGFLVVDLGVFNIQDQVDSNILVREIAEKVLENEHSCHIDQPVSTLHGCKSVGIVLGLSDKTLYEYALQMKDLKPSLCLDTTMIKLAKTNKVNFLCVGLETNNEKERFELVMDFLSN